MPRSPRNLVIAGLGVLGILAAIAVSLGWPPSTNSRTTSASLAGNSSPAAPTDSRAGRGSADPLPPDPSTAPALAGTVTASPAGRSPATSPTATAPKDPPKATATTPAQRPVAATIQVPTKTPTKAPVAMPAPSPTGGTSTKPPDRPAQSTPSQSPSERPSQTGTTSAPSSSAPAAGGAHAGVATYYAPAAPGGACLTMSIPASRYTAAANPTLFDGGAGCGSYVQVTGRKGTILVKIDNLCPECGVGHLDLSTEAFAAIDDLVKGLVPITYQEVRNPSISGGVILRVKDGSSQWWLGLRVDNAGNALASVEVADGAGAFRPLARQSWGWTESNPGKGPFRVRVTDIYRQTTTIDNVVLTPDQDQRTSSRLY